MGGGWFSGTPAPFNKSISDPYFRIINVVHGQNQERFSCQEQKSENK